MHRGVLPGVLPGAVPGWLCCCCRWQLIALPTPACPR
jgi:hypothetical protein